ncbi:MAG: uracil-DNA glycosylase [Campylobacterales bacterium]|nr:uracil-DNA glycosylase [Campylobacterales bacterium]
MKYLKDALLLKQLYQLKDLDYQYIDLTIADNDSDENRLLPNTLPQLNKLISTCHLCDISKVRESVVLAQGGMQADIVFVGFKPTMVDGSSRKVMSGSKGEMLDKIIENVLQIPKERIYITNLIKCYPKNDKTIHVNEIYSCRNYLYKELEIIQPKIVVTMGVESFFYLTNEDANLEDVRGKIIKHEPFAIMPIYDFGHILKNPSLKKELYRDMLGLKEFIA